MSGNSDLIVQTLTRDGASTIDALCHKTKLSRSVVLQTILGLISDGLAEASAFGRNGWVFRLSANDECRSSNNKQKLLRV